MCLSHFFVVSISDSDNEACLDPLIIKKIRLMNFSTISL